MIYREDFTLPVELLERINKQGFDILSELIQVIIDAAMQAEPINIPKNVWDMPIVTSRRRTIPGWVTSPSQSRRCVKDGSSRKRYCGQAKRNNRSRKVYL